MFGAPRSAAKALRREGAPPRRRDVGDFCREGAKARRIGGLAGRGSRAVRRRRASDAVGIRNASVSATTPEPMIGSAYAAAIDRADRNYAPLSTANESGPRSSPGEADRSFAPSRLRGKKSPASRLRGKKSLASLLRGHSRDA
jgi:hypothetical protein